MSCPSRCSSPHPPLWVACSRRETIRLAAEQGIGALSFSFVEPEEAKEWVDEYHGIIASERCVPAGFAVNPSVAVVLPMMCHADEATAIERGIDGAHFFGYSLAHYYVFGDHHPGRTSIWEEFLERRDEAGFAREIVTADQAPLGVKIMQQGLGSLRGAIGTPEQVRDLVRRYEQAGVDQIIFVSQAGNEPPRAHLRVARAVRRRGAARVRAARPRRARPPSASAWPRPWRRALARRAPPREADPEYVIAPLDSGPPAPRAGAGAEATAARRRTATAAPPAAWPRACNPGARRPSRPSCGAPTTAGSSAWWARMPGCACSSAGWRGASSPRRPMAFRARSSTC